MKKALETLRKELPAWLEPYNKFFDKYVDKTKYPIASKNIMVVEQLVEKSNQHCIEGWFDPDGTLHIWKISDYLYYPNDKESIDVYVTPSTAPKENQEKMINYAVETVKNHGIKYGFWNVEMWSKDDWLTVTEVNGRSASVWHNLYKNTFNKSLYKAMLYLACGEEEKCYQESPDSDASVSDRVGCQFHVITYGEGKAKDLLDFEYVRSIDETDVEVFVDEDDEIRQTRTTGFWLARFHLYGDDFSKLCTRADELRAKMLKKPELSPQPLKR
jgi:biotin carboxylase